MSAKRKRPGRITFTELERLVRQRSYIRPLDAVPPLHAMAKARAAAAEGDQAGTEAGRDSSDLP